MEFMMVHNCSDRSDFFNFYLTTSSLTTTHSEFASVAYMNLTVIIYDERFSFDKNECAL